MAAQKIAQKAELACVPPAPDTECKMHSESEALPPAEGSLVGVGHQPRHICAGWETA